MHLILVFIERKHTATVCLHQHFMAVRLWSFEFRCDILTFHCGEYSCLETTTNVEAEDFPETPVHMYQSKRHYILLYYKLHNTLLFVALPEIPFSILAKRPKTQLRRLSFSCINNHNLILLVEIKFAVQYVTSSVRVHNGYDMFAIL